MLLLFFHLFLWLSFVVPIVYTFHGADHGFDTVDLLFRSRREGRCILPQDDYCGHPLASKLLLVVIMHSQEGWPSPVFSYMSSYEHRADPMCRWFRRSL